MSRGAGKCHPDTQYLSGEHSISNMDVNNNRRSNMKQKLTEMKMYINIDIIVHNFITLLFTEQQLLVDTMSNIAT